MMHVALELHIGSNLLDDDSADHASLGIPTHVVPDLEIFRAHITPIKLSGSTSYQLSLASNDLSVSAETA